MFQSLEIIDLPRVLNVIILKIKSILHILFDGSAKQQNRSLI
jgi:hypothetical protein